MSPTSLRAAEGVLFLALAEITPDHCVGYWRNCGYRSLPCSNADVDAAIVREAAWHYHANIVSVRP
jgi:hypothetical protein